MGLGMCYGYGTIGTVAMLGPGRPAKRPSIDAVRELTRDEVRLIPRSRTPAVIQLRDTHHMVARLFALGLRPNEVASRTGYGIARISVLRNDPAMQELIASYRDAVDESWKETADEYFTNAAAVRTTAIRLIRDRLEEAEPGDIPLNQLVAIHADTADRTGYPKRKESVNLNVDFAARLEQAVQRSSAAQKTIDITPVPAPTLASAGEARADPSPVTGQGVVAQPERMDAPQAGSPSSVSRFLPQPREQRRG